MSLWDQGGVDELHPEVAAFLAKTRAKPICMARELLQGKVTTKCGLVDQAKTLTTVWFSDTTCSNCLAGINNHDRQGTAAAVAVRP